MSQSPRADRHPQDWYPEQRWVTEALLDAPGLHGLFKPDEVIWDPACGLGTIPKLFSERGHNALMSDIVDRCGLLLETQDFRDARRLTMPRPVSIVCNPPYSCEDGILEAFIEQACRLATRKVAMLMPLARQCGIARDELFDRLKPLAICPMMERPSMPPGEQVLALGDKAYKRGRIDFMWVVWDVRNLNARTQWIKLPPRPLAARDPRKAVAL